MSCSSTSRRQKHSASKRHRRCSPAPMRSSIGLLFAASAHGFWTRSSLRRSINLGLARERIRHRSSQAVNLSGRVVEHLALL